MRAALASTGGPDPREALAALIAREYGSAGVVLCGSGTEALVLALEAAERLLGDRRPVGLPAFSCFDVAAAAVRFARPVRFYDIDPNTLAPDVVSLRAALAHGVGPLVVASAFGVPVDWTVLEPALAGSNTVLIEDAAQGHGGRWRGARLGAFGRLGVLSFGRGKGWTGGAGGALLVRDAADLPKVADLWPPDPGGLDSFAALVRATAHRVLGRPWVYGLPRGLPGLGLGETRYRDASPPKGMPPAAAALALNSFELAEREAGLREAAASEYAAVLPTSRQVRIPEGGRGGWVRFPLLIPGGMEALTDPTEALVLGAAASYPRSLPALPEVAPLAGPESGRRWPGAGRLAAELVTLPTHGLTTREERRRLVELVDGVGRTTIGA